ncbi:hypothetical protein [Noviherbaspirillum malthae]|jgi:hypothetical protein|uniref:hypothetical protein n=1 Tax=Noviherbaspirillum malthae TaxID=1260987 RepID=UPI00188EE78D|nr:hypothetical protein [Noviherbaspirillum malthae]
MAITNIHNAASFQEEVLASLKELDRLNQRKTSTLATLGKHFSQLVNEKLVPGALIDLRDFHGGAYKAKVINGTHVQNTPFFRIDQAPVVTVDDRPLNSSWTVVATPLRPGDMKPYFSAVTLQGYVFQGRAEINLEASDNDNILHHLGTWEREQRSKAS